jgi:glycosyltransferase involved in cell wall biosynthesis
MKSKKPLFSIITIVYNDVQNIEQTINSVINQTYKNFEYIIIDGGSTDGTVDIIKKYSKRIDYWVSEKDGGIYPAMNKGIKVANGQIINMMNSGDYYYSKDVLDKVAKYFIKNINLSFVLGLSKFVKNDGTDFLINKKPYFSTLKAGMFNTISHQAFFYKKELHKDLGLYDLKFKICADGYFMYRAYHSKKYDRKLISEIFSVCRSEGVSSTPESLLEHKIFYDEVFGKSILNELLYVKYLLRKNKFGRFVYKIYLSIKLKMKGFKE